MPAASRRVLTVVVGAALGLAALGQAPLPAIAEDPVPFGWANDAGVQADGHVETDQDRQQILGSITANGGPKPSAGSGSAGPAPQCVWKSLDELGEGSSEGASDPFDPDGVESVLYARVCDGAVVGWQWFQVQDQGDLLAAATDDVRRRLPAPRPVLSPDPAQGLVVKVATWFAVPAGQWVPVTGTAEALGLAVAVTATPVALTFDPGDGARPVTCAGPGQTFDPAAPTPASDPACSYVYRDASTAALNGRSWPASLSVRWQVTWLATGGQSGALQALTTTTAVDAVVHEYQAVEGSGS
ncbi:hypothetical protein [Pseudofrankia sp. BMG5.36]|uniref:hypothetical protein n=1 Tax=Pseudofrankia sp. BMG5.36 TaxID=1834512 RepID=UPI0008D931AA|nr:hypothetical protein [Pseudofrankia sp. BMG5.36]OHV64193.1 hypothetical protein BCD48_37745 [Pseudofrankia sp. BMG5.36]